MQTNDIPTSDTYDTTTQAREHLQHAEALFAAIMKMTDDNETAYQLARLGALAAGQAADDFDVQAQAIAAQEAAQ